MGYYLKKQMAEPADETESAARLPRLAAKTPLGAPFCYTILSTKYWDADTKTLAYQLRDYGPGIGKWLSRDSMGEWNENLYVICANNTATHFDLLGLLVIYNDAGNPLIDVDNVFAAIQELRTMKDRPYASLPEFNDTKVSGGERRSTGFVSCDYCPTPPHTVYPCTAFGRWKRNTPKGIIRLSIWLDYKSETVTDDQRRLWDQVQAEVSRHEQGHVDIFEGYANQLNWYHEVTVISCGSYEAACAAAQVYLEVAHEVHVNKIKLGNKSDQDTYQKKDVPETWRRIAELEGKYKK